MCECSVQLYTTDDVPLCRRHVTKLEMRDSIHPRVRGLLQPAGAEERAKAGRYDTPLIEERMTKNGTESCKLQTKNGTESAAKDSGKEQNRKLQGHQGGRPRLAAIHHMKIGQPGQTHRRLHEGRDHQQLLQGTELVVEKDVEQRSSRSLERCRRRKWMEHGLQL